ncbi:hypothetical protein OAU99_01810 [Candidatus Poseidoniaceae archaeon]|jgi:hypothetical protein|nr:hypothetical protein [Candidatus Poseidoniaceae archaeon]MDC3339733.1 hypothetical protein [bacterium]|tara:strand:- start:516 stop:725 length:210 start_codon:yes stop_codon:yes gene_type:complete
MIGDYHTVCSGCGKSLTGNWLAKKMAIVAGFVVVGFWEEIFWFLGIWAIFIGWGPPNDCGCTYVHTGHN